MEVYQEKIKVKGSKKMRKYKIKKIFESKEINGNLAILCNVRNAIKWQDKEKINNLIDIFDYNFTEIDYTELLKNDNKVYVIQTASNRFIEVEQEDLKKIESY